MAAPNGLVKMADQVKALRDEVVALGGGGGRPPPPQPCSRCGNMTSGEQCKACDMRDLLMDEDHSKL